jgi:chromosome segregation ATPase
LDSPSATPTKSKEITFSQPLANLVRTQTTRIRALATNNTIGALKPHLDELAISQDLVEAELRKVRLRNAELEKRSTQLEKDIETATLQLRDVLVGNLSTEEKLLQEREKLMEEQKTQGKIKGEAQTFQQQLTFTQDEAKKSRAQLDELGSQLSQRDLRLKQLESTLESEKTTLTQQLEDVQQKYSKQVEELQQKQAKQVEELNKAKEEALESLRKEYEAKLVAAVRVACCLLSLFRATA